MQPNNFVLLSLVECKGIVAPPISPTKKTLRATDDFMLAAAPAGVVVAKEGVEFLIPWGNITYVRAAEGESFATEK